jgi:hypothetical protein
MARKEALKFALGDEVEWISTAAGSTKTKRGIVAEIVPAGKTPSPLWTQLHKGWGVGFPRNHESYVVTTGRNGSRPYWPLANKLRPI